MCHHQYRARFLSLTLSELSRYLACTGVWRTRLDESGLANFPRPVLSTSVKVQRAKIAKRGGIVYSLPDTRSPWGGGGGGGTAACACCSKSVAPVTGQKKITVLSLHKEILDLLG